MGWVGLGWVGLGWVGLGWWLHGFIMNYKNALFGYTTASAFKQSVSSQQSNMDLMSEQMLMPGLCSFVNDG